MLPDQILHLIHQKRTNLHYQDVIEEFKAMHNSNNMHCKWCQYFTFNKCPMCKINMCNFCNRLGFCYECYYIKSNINNVSYMYRNILMAEVCGIYFYQKFYKKEDISISNYIEMLSSIYLMHKFHTRDICAIYLNKFSDNQNYIPFIIAGSFVSVFIIHSHISQFVYNLVKYNRLPFL